MTCKNLIGICSKTKLPCPYCGVSGHCNESECENEAIPAWQEAIDVWKTAKVRTRNRTGNMESAIKRFLKALGANVGDKIAVDDDDIDRVYQNLLEQKFALSTIYDTFEFVKECISRNRDIRKQYRKIGKMPPEIDFPEIVVPTKEPSRLTPEQRVAINMAMYMLRYKALKGDKVARRRYIWCWFAWRTGMRPSDIGRVTWKCIKIMPDGKIKIDYVPNKTDKATCGRPAGSTITPEEYFEIKPFIGNPDDPVIVKFANRIPKSGCVKVSHGEYTHMYKAIRKWVIGLMKLVGVKDTNPAYVLRKDCATVITEKLGPLHAAQMIGDNVMTMLKHYVNFHGANLKEGL